LVDIAIILDLKGALQFLVPNLAINMFS